MNSNLSQKDHRRSDCKGVTQTLRDTEKPDRLLA